MTGRRRLAVACGVLLTIALPAVAPPGAGAQTPADEAAAPGLRLASQTPAVAGGATFELRVVPEGAGALDLRWSLHDAVRNRTQLTATLDGERLPSRLRRTTAPVAELPLDADGATTIAIGPEAVDRRTSGAVLPVVVELLDGAEVVDRLVTHLVRLPDPTDAPPLAVAWAQPLRAPPALRPDGASRFEPDTEAALEATIDALVSVPGTPLSLLPTPETVAALGAVRPQLLADLAGALEGRQVVADTFVEVDVRSMVEGGLGATALELLASGPEVLAAALGTAPPPLATWAVDAPLKPGDLGVLSAIGAERLVVAEADLVPLDLPITLTRPFTLEDGDSRIAAAAADPLLADHFRTDDPVLGASHLLADLAFLYFDAPLSQARRGVVVRPPDDAEPSAAFLTTALRGLAALDNLEPVTLDGLFEAVGGEADDELVRELAGADDRRAAGGGRRRLADLRPSVDGLASMVGAEDPEVALLRRLLLVGQAEGLDADDRARYADGVEARTEDRTDDVGLLDRGSYRLTAREGTIPLTLVNGSDPLQELAVRVTLESDRLDFADADPGTATRRTFSAVLGRESTPLVVDVRARTTGAFPVELVVTSPDGALEVGRFRLTVRSTAASGVGVVLSGGAAAFLCLWWGRHWRSARRSRRLVPEADPAATGATA